LWALMFLFAVGCKEETTIDDRKCPPAGTELTYDNFGRDFMNDNCQTCHGKHSSDRNGAPSSYDFGTLEGVRDHKDRIFVRAAADNTTMPPGPDDPPDADREKLA